MKKKNTIDLQCIGMRLLVLSCLAGSLLGCASSLDQTNEDLNSPAGGMAYIAGQMHAQGDDEGAMEFYARAIQKSPNDVAARFKLAELFEAHGGYKDAAEQYRALVKLRPKNADFWRGYGRNLLRLEHPKEAREKYETALKLAPDDTRSLNGLGIALDLLGDHAGAQEKYKAALDQKSGDMVTLNNLGHSYNLSGDYADTIKLLEPKADDSDAPAALRENLAEAYVLTGDDETAEHYLKMDLTAEQVKKKLARFHALRAKAVQAKPPTVKEPASKPAAVAASPKTQPAETSKAEAQPEQPTSPYAMLGSFTTTEYAQARLDTVSQQFPKETEQLMLEIVPGVDEIEGSQIFDTRAGGFKSPAEAKAFCDKLAKGGAFCKVRGG